MAIISEYSLKTIKTQITNAIARSKARNSIVSICIDPDDGDYSHALTVIDGLAECETDYSIHDREGIDRMDIWGFAKDSKERSMLWRLSITWKN